MKTNKEPNPKPIRTDTELLDGLERLPYQMEIIYKGSLPKADSMPTLREQINRFLDAVE